MLILIGSNHRSTPVAMRERMAFSKDDLPRVLAELMSRDGIDEAMVLSTCNRVEVLVRCSAGGETGSEILRDFLARQHGISREELARYSYRYQGRDAVQHLFRVAAGLDSMILGEAQILGQVKQAYLSAREHKTTGPILDRLLQHCLATSKRVRTETGISRHAVSVAYAAVRLGCKIFGKLQGRSALLLGAGKMSDLVARHLKSNGVERIVVTSRTYTHAVASAELCGGRAVPWDDGIDQLAAADIVVSATGSPRPILVKKDVARAMRARRARPLFLIDIAVPRDVDPAVNELDNVYVYDIDALQGVIDSNIEERRRAARRAQELIATEVEAFERWRQTKDLTPVIVSLRETLLDVGRNEMQRQRTKLGALDERQRQVVEELTRAMIHKILHRPIRHLRGAVERGDTQECTALYEKIFGLDPSPAVPGKPGPRESATKDGGDDGPVEARGPQRVLKGGKEL